MENGIDKNSLKANYVEIKFKRMFERGFYSFA